ncbi:MAG: DUF6629 family protein [Parasphingorhabdus sp.]|uniref:DUF6629 family protein n=1 Tax=Parasphingorhabdus sp. TaxID=2709688 RepID=UPI003001B7B3
MIICFSANASILAGIALLGIGTVTVRRTDALAQLPYAVIPIAFGAQQLVEGYLWTILSTESQTTNMLIPIYLLFSHVLWPIFVPLAVLMIEPRTERRKLLAIPMGAGILAGTFFLLALFTKPVSAIIEGRHIVYHLPHRYDAIILTLYIIGTCLTPLLSSYKTIRLFGIVISVALIATWMVYMNWFASVWCFFAAIASGVILGHFSHNRTSDNRNLEAATPASVPGN